MDGIGYMWQILVVGYIVKDELLHHLLEHQNDVVGIGVVELLKALLGRYYDLVDVTWCLGML